MNKKVLSYVYLVLGTLILSVGYAMFMSPYRITPGGIYGISIVLHHTFGFPLGLSALCFNFPLFIIGLRLLGQGFGIKTFFGFVLTAIFTDGIGYLFGADPLMLGEDVLLASIFGGFIMGIGVGLIFKAKASSGGTDVIAMIVNKYTKIPLGQLMIMIDSCVVVVGFLVFKDWKLPLYSWLTIFIMGKVIDVVLQGFSNDKTVMIISDKNEEIRAYILNVLNRGGTILDGKGMYTKMPKELLYVVVNRKELIVLQEHIQSVDPKAFLVVGDANEILGQGFKSLEEKVKK